MAQVDLKIAGRTYEIACRDGEEAHLRQLADIVDGKAVQAGRALGGVNEARQLLLASLLLADELNDRLEKVADGLEARQPD
jgi:cell division protein ZapA